MLEHRSALFWKLVRLGSSKLAAAIVDVILRHENYVLFH